MYSGACNHLQRCVHSLLVPFPSLFRISLSTKHEDEAGSELPFLLYRVYFRSVFTSVTTMGMLDIICDYILRMFCVDFIRSSLMVYRLIWWPSSASCSCEIFMLCKMSSPSACRFAMKRGRVSAGWRGTVKLSEYYIWKVYYISDIRILVPSGLLVMSQGFHWPPSLQWLLCPGVRWG
jgi:hypothetical protein